ncbi:MAG TPA: hypothetical protein VGG31_04200 [Candidatus Dormibacteraeota bacterium]
MGYAVEGIAYVAGVLIIGQGLYLALKGSFPSWYEKRLTWPVVNATPAVTRLQGAATVGLGLSVLALVFTTIVSAKTGGGLVVLAILLYVIGAALFMFSAWRSRNYT